MWKLCSKIYLIGNSFWKFYEVRSERGDFNSCGKWSSRVLSTFNAVVVVGVVSLLLFRLPMAILWVERNHKKSLQHLKTCFHVYFIRGLPKYVRNWIFKGSQRRRKKVQSDGLDWLCYLAGSSRCHHGNSIYCLFLQFPHKVDNEKRCQILESLFVVLFSSTP